MITRNLDIARKAYKEQDIQMMRNTHNNGEETENILSTSSIKKHDEHHKRIGDFLKSAVYGGLDGIITTYAVVMGALGAKLGISVVVILGVANMLGDGISMALGDYLSTKTETEYQLSEKKREEWEVENNPEGEKKEMAEVYISRGVPEEDAHLLSEVISKNKKAWVDIMMVEELGIVINEESPVKGAIVTFFSFVLFGIIPLLPFIAVTIGKIQESNLFLISSILTGFSLFLLGSIKSIFTIRNFMYSGVETLTVGVIAAGVSFLVGYLLEPLAESNQTMKNQQVVNLQENQIKQYKVINISRFYYRTVVNQAFNYKKEQKNSKFQRKKCQKYLVIYFSSWIYIKKMFQI